MSRQYRDPSPIDLPLSWNPRETSEPAGEVGFSVRENPAVSAVLEYEEDDLPSGGLLRLQTSPKVRGGVKWGREEA